MTVVLKLGGSVVTEKDEPETVATDRLADLAGAVADSGVSDLVVVHGGGSFGHPHAAEHGVSSTEGTKDAAAVRDIAGAMEDLNEAVVDALADAGVPAVPVHPFSAGFRGEDGHLFLPTGQLDAMLEEGFVPVLHGDVLAHAGEGATIVSGDELVVRLADRLVADRVGLCSTVPGVLDQHGDVIPEITAYEDAAAALGESDATDVTGGMAAKVEALLGLGSPAFVFGPDDLDDFLAGRDAGTRIDG
ncbi:isopentenyl phosphate kinase [Halobacterium litoreum]|uniref:Isopentenyl phosphate kinase n=1 Tax=Halobacterium litoreum TaxID=2039234 RepID=A0ABD5NC50_9EURY|nr:isopentenyl phosphate kinase [Halobacterium litoreum]UHH14289.1 isopentenyl phosphate kinase family protein [Halobacterium litoreum]